MEGTILCGTNNHFTVLCDDGGKRLCAIKGKRIKDKTGVYNALAAGDEVEIAADKASRPREAESPGLMERGMITALRGRKNVFGRYNEKGRAQQAIAANVDIVVCVASPAYPPFRPRFVDRVAILAEAARVPLLIALNKSDLGIDEETDERLALYEKLGYGSMRCSAASGQNVAGLLDSLRGKTSVFVGQSGVGKTSLLNAIQPGLGRRTGEVSEKYARGRHTTTMAELIVLTGDTRIIDTPGVRRLALRGIDPVGLDAYFPELAKLSPLCEFGLSCTHTDESGCRITRAVAEGLVHEDRYESYLRVRFELEANAEHSPREGRSAPGPRSSGIRRGDGARKTARFHGKDGDEDD
jgi:ribosome biogenesis GTPase / thiamine phosphate phosphatase